VATILPLKRAGEKSLNHQQLSQALPDFADAL